MPWCWGAKTARHALTKHDSTPEYGFATYQRTTIARKGDALGEQLKVNRGSAESVDLLLGSGLSMLLRQWSSQPAEDGGGDPGKHRCPGGSRAGVGFVRVLLGETVVAKLNVVAASAGPLPGFIEGFFRIINAWRSAETCRIASFAV